MVLLLCLHYSLAVIVLPVAVADDDNEYTNTFSASCSFYSYTPHFPSPSSSFTIPIYFENLSLHLITFLFFRPTKWTPHATRSTMQTTNKPSTQLIHTFSREWQTGYAAGCFPAVDLGGHSRYSASRVRVG